jgi:hypothetical protein
MGLLHQPLKIEEEGGIGGKAISRGKPKCLEKNLPKSQIIYHKSLELNLGPPQ